MTTTQWFVTLAITLIAGGAMGAIINNLWLKYNNRKQPIGIRREIIPIMNQDIRGASLKTKIVLERKGKSSTYENLSLGRVTLVNTGNKDYEEFNFGLTLSGLNMAVALQPETQDRYHEMSSSPPIDLGVLDNEIDFTLKPFYRNDTYSVVIYILPEPRSDGENSLIEIELIPKHPVRFVELSAYRGLAKSVAIEVMGGIPT
ncbi:MAG: hypothetical protein ACREA9_00375, partial [Pyrinomonadaceae bacterium]